MRTPKKFAPKGKEKRRVKKIDRKVNKLIKKGGDKRTLEKMRTLAKRTPGSKVASKAQTKRAMKKGKLNLPTTDMRMTTSSKPVKKPIKPVKKPKNKRAKRLT